MAGRLLHTTETMKDAEFVQLVKRTPEGFRWWPKRSLEDVAKLKVYPQRRTPKPRLVEVILFAGTDETVKATARLLTKHRMTFEAELAEIDNERRPRRRQ